jgi:SAM-dependent methyltransferase
MDRELDIGRLRPARHAMPLLAEGRLWCPVPTEHPAGGHPWRPVVMRPWEIAAWRAMNGARTTESISAMVGRDVRPLLARLAAPAVQAVQLREAPARLPDLSLERLVAVGRDVHAGASHDLRSFHQAIDDADRRFDHAETTLAHALGPAHPALGGVRYGAALRRRLSTLGISTDDVVEIGPGTGELAEAWLGEGAAAYLRVDLSPALLAAQGRRLPHTRGLEGSATALPLADGSVHCLVANEVIADLEAAEGGGPIAARNGLAGREGLYNVGALRFVEEIARVLAPGGAAFLSEFGGPDEEPIPTSQLDHREVSIRFDDLAAVARHCGLRVELAPIGELLGLDLDARWLWRPHLAALRAMGFDVAARAWTPATLPVPVAVEGLRWVSLRDEGPGPLPARIWGMVLRRAR